MRTVSRRMRPQPSARVISRPQPPGDKPLFWLPFNEIADAADGRVPTLWGGRDVGHATTVRAVPLPAHGIGPWRANIKSAPQPPRSYSGQPIEALQLERLTGNDCLARLGDHVIPSPGDQNLWAQSLRPMDMTCLKPVKPKRVTPSGTWYNSWRSSAVSGRRGSFRWRDMGHLRARGSPHHYTSFHGRRPTRRRLRWRWTTSMRAIAM